jgi:hypothetical protein
VNFGLFADYDVRWVLIGVACDHRQVLLVAEQRRAGPSGHSSRVDSWSVRAMGNVIDRCCRGRYRFLNVVLWVHAMHSTSLTSLFS